MFEQRRWKALWFGLGVLAVGGLAFAGLGYGLVLLLSTGVYITAPLLTALCMGLTTLTVLASALVGLRFAVSRLVSGNSSQRMLTFIGIALLMSLIPLLMIWMVVLLIVMRPQ